LAQIFNHLNLLQPSPHDILFRIKNGDEKAFKELFLVQYAGLCAYANKYLNDMDQAEETVQDLFFNLWQKRERLEINLSMEAYLFRSVRNACLNMLKHIKIREIYKETHERELRESESKHDAPLETSELEAAIEAAIESMPPERKRIFKMSRLEGMKYREIAGALNLSVKTVEAQMGKALKYLRECLNDYLIWLLIVMHFLHR